MERKLTPAVYLLVKLIFIYLLSIGMVMIFAENSGIEGETATLSICMAVLAVVLAAAVIAIPKPVFAGILAAAGIAVFIFIFREDLAAGADIFLGRLYDRAAAYFEHTQAPDFQIKETELRAAVLFVSFLGAVWEVWLIFLNLKKRHILCVLFPILGVISVLLAIGSVPPLVSALCLFSGFLGLTALGDMSVKTAAVRLKATAAAMAVFLAALGSSAAFMPENGWLKAEEKQQIKQAVREKYEEAGEWLNTVSLNPFKNKFGISKGRLDRAGNLEYEGKTVMTVSTSRIPANLLYLKAYGASRFENNRWWEIDGSEIEKISGSFGLDSEQYLREIWNSERNADDGSQYEMVIKPGKAVDSMIYVPYTAALSAGDKVSAEGYVTELSGGQERKITYSDSFYGAMKSLDISGFHSAGGEVMTSYNDFVRENYLSVEGMSGRFREDFKMAETQKNAALTAEFIRECFKSRAITYTLEPGNTPSGDNAVDYFLYENKKGYCMHFASAAVMIFRLNGIPARYAEGYIVSPGSFYGSGQGAPVSSPGEREAPVSLDGGYVTQVRDYQAHAWPEIYISSFGWVPVEVTPAYEDESLIAENTNPSLDHRETESTEMESTGTDWDDGRTESREQTENTDTGGEGGQQDDSKGGEETSEKNDADGGENGGLDESGGGNGNTSLTKESIFESAVFIKIFVGIILALSMAAAFWLYVRIALGRHMAAIEGTFSSKSAGSLASFTYRWFALADIKTAKKQEMKELVSEVCEKIPEVNEHLLIFLLDKLLKAAYSENGLTREEYVQARTAFYAVSSTIYKNLRWPLKLTARFILCLPYDKTKEKK